MKISEILKKQFTVSFEFFPPKTEEGETELFKNLKRLEELRPSFVSVTYGAGGGTRDRTRRIVTLIAHEEKLNVMAHLTSIGHSKKEILDILNNYLEAKIDNILALRGDPQAGSVFNPKNEEMPHAADLIRLIRDNFDDYFSIGGAVFTARHPESPNWDWEMSRLQQKAEAGMEFAITQLFFENKNFYEFMDRCLKYKINIPVIPGIMPITSFNQIAKFSAMCNATIPEKTTELMEKYQDRSDEVEKIGVEYAVNQCEDLLKNKVRGLHFYTLNKSPATLKIYKALQIQGGK